MPQRPASVTVFAIIDIVMAVLGVFGIAWMIIDRMGLIQFDNSQNPVAQAMEDNRAYVLFTEVASWLGIVATVAVLCAAIGMLQLKNWARLTAIAWAVYSTVMTALGAVMNYVLIFGPVIRDTTGPERIGMIVGMVFMIVITLAFMVFFLLQVYFLTRPKVVEAFRLAAEFEQQRDADVTASAGDRL